MTLDDIKNEIENANNIVIFAHEKPDGDAIGSSLAFYIAMKNLGKDVDVIIPHYPSDFKFLPCSNEVKLKPDIEKYDLAIALDCGDIKRLDDPEETYLKAKTRINIDHHMSNGMFGDYNYVDPVSPACCQIITGMFKYYGYTIDKNIATCIIAGIITDTGGFKYEGVTSETFEIASEFLGMGVNISKIYKNCMGRISREKFEVRKLAADRIEFLADNKIAYTYITKEDMEKYHVDQNDLDGIVENGRDVDGVEISIFLYETDKGFKASLRSNDYVNVSDICLLFNGGGHMKAAGCTLQYPLDEAKDRILNATKRFLK